MTKGSDAIAALLTDAKERQAQVAREVDAAERTLAKRRKKLQEVSAEVASLETDLSALRRRGNLSIVKDSG
jgi:septal ring factor EnvC (AmiA/AmiB activator)